MSDNTKFDYNLKLKLLEAFIFASPEPVKFNSLKQFEDDDDNLITSTRLINNYSFDNTIPSLNTVTIDNVTSNNIMTSPTSSLDINELTNQPYDASMGPFSPVPSNSSLSPTSRNLNILNTTEFNINTHSNNDDNNNEMAL